MIANDIFKGHQSQKKCNLIEKFDYYINLPITTKIVRNYVEGYNKNFGKKVSKQWTKLTSFTKDKTYNRDKTILRKQILAYVNGIDKCSSGTHTVTIYELITGALQWKRFINFEETVNFLTNSNDTDDLKRLERCHILIDIMWFEKGMLGKKKTYLEHQKEKQEKKTEKIDKKDDKAEKQRKKGNEKPTV